jgi:beta-lactamase regulating signal transducer with metallopeptidase domain
MNPVFSQTIVQALGWTLIHFLWQGLVIAALLASGLRIFRNSPAHYKYLAGCAAMALMALAPLVTFRLVLFQPEPLPAITPISAKISTVETSGTFTLAQPTRTAIPGPHAAGLFERLNHLLPWLVLGWLAGVCALSGRLFLGWLQVRRFRQTATHPLPAPWPDKLAALAQRLGINHSIQLLQSALIEVPTVIGWLRPVILLPASCLTGLTPGQLEAIIAHELAHIRRHDYLVNLLQSTIETLLFYHPAVWWVSRRIREERENCCDDLAVAVSGDPVGYARALATLEELRPASAQLMLAAGGAPLLQRIRRLAGQPERSASRASWPVAGIALLLVLGILAAGRMEHRAAAVPQLTDETNKNKPPPLEVRTFHLDPNTPWQILQNHIGELCPADSNGFIMRTNNGRVIQFRIPATNDDTSPLSSLFRAYFICDGMDFGTNTGKAVIFNESKSTLTVRATFQDMIRIEPDLQFLRVIALKLHSPGKLINSSPPPVTVETNADGVQTIRLVATNFVSTAVTNQTQLATLIQDGKFLYESGRYDEAAIKFKQARAIDPGNLPALQYLRLMTEKQIIMNRSNSFKVAAESVVTTSSPGTSSTATTPTSDRVPAAASPNPARPAGDLPEINIKAKFVEITTAPGDTNMFFTTNGPGATGSFTGLLTDPQFHAAINALEQRNGTEILSSPEVTTESGRQAQMQIGDMQKIVLPGKGTNVSTTNMFVGETLDTIATVSADKKSIDMRLIPSITEFIGYDDPGRAVPVVDYVAKDGTTTSKLSEPMPSNVPLPHFRLRQTTANVTTWDCQTVVIGGMVTDGTNTASQSVKKEILIFVTATLINPDGTRYHSDEEVKALLAGPPPQQGSTNQ